MLILPKWHLLIFVQWYFPGLHFLEMQCSSLSLFQWRPVCVRMDGTRKRGLIKVGKHPRAKNGREHAKEGWVDRGGNKPSQLRCCRQKNEYEEQSEFASFLQNFVFLRSWNQWE
jgi:hypothetical protein